MSKSAHTPGPWRIGDAGHTVFGPPNGNPSPETVAHVSHKKNSSLIAVAPRLLEELEAALDCLEQYHRYGEEMRKIGRGPHIVDPNGATMDSVFAGISATIAAARGEAA